MVRKITPSPEHHMASNRNSDVRCILSNLFVFGLAGYFKK
jgi:hypothetical protein